MIKRQVSIILLSLLLSVLYAKRKTAIKSPYYVKADVATSSSEEYSYAGLNIELYNKSDKEIVSFTVTFSLFGEDGLPLFNEDYKTVEISSSIPPRESKTTCISLDDYIDNDVDFSLDEEDESEWGKPYGADVIFITSITYADNSIWTESSGN